MLAQIFGSNARVKIMKTFLSKPEQKYYTRQLARDLNLQVNSVRRELENLENIGLIKQEEGEALASEIKEKAKTGDKNLKNEKKYFTIERNFLLFPELKSLFAKANLLSCQDFLKDAAEFGEIKQLWLSGIFSGDTSAPTDMLLVGKIKKDKFVKKLQSLEADLNKEINYTLMDESEYEYRLEIHDIFLNRIRQSRHLKIISGEEENN
ncbi:MAG: hypothetical protein PHG95_02360 [Patescibacteria group bacterium]|nr:hypothetical protein [Patescibacteria group bacterium]